MINISQATVFEFLKKNKSDWWSAKEIATELDQGIGSVTINLQRLRRTDLIKYRLENIKYFYKYNRK